MPKIHADDLARLHRYIEDYREQGEQLGPDSYEQGVYQGLRLAATILGADQ